MQEIWVKLVRGTDRPDLIVADNANYLLFWEALSDRQRFVGSKSMADAGWSNLAFNTAPVVLDGGIGGAAPDKTMYFLNCKYLFLRPHSRRNMTLKKDLFPTNQDAMVKLLLWAGNLCSDGLQFQGIVRGS